MRRHDLDLTSLLAGIVFAAVAAAGLASPGLDVALDPLWLVPGVLVALGLAGLLGTWSRMRRDAADAPRTGSGPADTAPAAPTDDGPGDTDPAPAAPDDAAPTRTDTAPVDDTEDVRDD